MADASALIALASIRQLDLLPQLFGRVLIPPAVEREIAAPEHGGRIFEGLGWLDTENLTAQSARQALELNVDRGEAEAILLAEELGAALVIDDRRGRELATVRGVPITGTVGVLLLAKRRGKIPALAPLLDALQRNGIFLGATLVRQALELSGEP